MAYFLILGFGMQTLLHSHRPLLFLHRFKVEKCFCAQVQLLESERTRGYDIYKYPIIISDCLLSIFWDIRWKNGMGENSFFFIELLCWPVSVRTSSFLFKRFPIRICTNCAKYKPKKLLQGITVELCLYTLSIVTVRTDLKSQFL